MKKRVQQSMTISGEDETIEVEAGTDPRQLLIDWANKQDSWVRRLVNQVVSSRRPPSSEQCQQLFELFLAEKGIEGALPEVEPKLEVSTDGASAADDLRFLKLAQVVGVNALNEGESIEFSKGLTILYGENGTVKTGYARVLKRLGGVRDADEILPNIHASKSAPPSAKVSYKLGEDEIELHWANEFGVAPFTRTSVFDSPAVNIRVDDNISYVFTPAEISLFTYVTSGIREVQQLAADHLKEITPASNPNLKGFQQGTTIYQQVETLGPATDLVQLETLAKLPDGALEEKQRLERLAASLRSNLTETLLEPVRT